MTDAFWNNLPQTLTALGVIISIFVGLWNARSINHNSAKIQEVHQLTNSMSTELNRVTGNAARAEGKLSGLAEGKATEQGEQRSRDTIAGVSNRGRDAATNPVEKAVEAVAVRVVENVVDKSVVDKSKL